jgi:hypothetical protein
MVQHTAYRQGPSNKLGAQTRTIVFVALGLFALAGLISGFAIGAFVHSPRAHQATPLQHVVTPIIARQTQIATPTTHVQQPKKLGWPVIQQRPSDMEVADGNTTYTISIQAVDQSIDKAHGQPVHASTISCKIWLTKDGNVSKNMPPDRLLAVDTLSSPFPKEEPNALNFFDPATQQTQLTNNKGQASWNYKLPTSLKPGKYFLVVLTDWKGLYANWIWIQIQVSR